MADIGAVPSPESALNPNNSPLEYLASFAISFVAGMVSLAVLMALRRPSKSVKD